jgi:UDP-glucose 4-epimerase
VSLRYFNVAGAVRTGGPGAPGSDGGWLGERHTVETHLIPNILRIARDPERSVSIFGDDYPTADGSCVRDYIHVADLAGAHLLALGACTPSAHTIYNLRLLQLRGPGGLPVRHRPRHPGPHHRAPRRRPGRADRLVRPHQR